MPALLGGSTRKALQCAESLKQVSPAKGDLLRAPSCRWKSAGRRRKPCFQKALAKAPSDPEVVAGYLDALGSHETKRALGESEQRRRLAADAGACCPACASPPRG